MDDAAGDSYIPQKTINPIINKDEVDVIRDPLTLNLSEEKFLEYAKTLKREAEEFWGESGAKGINLNKRREDLEKYYFGRQYAGEQRKGYMSGTSDNMFWESMTYLKAMALSKMPDITVTPGDDSEEKKLLAKQISKVLTSDLQSRERKRVLGLAFKHIPVYLTGIIKPFWNPQKGKFGDRDLKVVQPGNVTLDFRAGSNDVRDMDFIFEVCEDTVKEMVMKWPKKAEDLYKELRKANVFRGQNASDGPNDKNEQGMNTKVKYIEVWFKWYDHPEDEDDKQIWEEVIGVAHYYQGCLLDKMKHPYWDWTGTPQTFTYELKQTGDNKFKKIKTPANKDVLSKLLAGEDMGDTENETIYHNHLDYPEFPYIFLGFDQWGKTPVDETSSFEQSLGIQMSYDKRNRQLDDTLDSSRGKYVFSASEGLTKDDVANYDQKDPDQQLLIRGDLNKTFKFLPGEQPSPAVIQNVQDSRERIFDKLGIHAATRGQVNTETAATNNQIGREGDFTRMDDYVDDTINYAAEKIANWDMQLMKLFYTETHFRSILGEDGKWVNVKLHRDYIDDGFQVILSASGSDKLKAEQEATDDAKMKLTDPYRYFVDKGRSDPRGRTLSLMTFLMNPQAYLLDIQNGGDGSSMQNGIQAAATVVNGQPQPGGAAQPGQQSPGGQPPQPGQQPGQGGGDPQALQDIMQITQGHVPQVPQQVSPGYLQTFTAFMHSQQVEEAMQKFGPQFKAQLIQFAKAIAQLGHAVQQQGQPPVPGQFPHPAVAQVGGPGNQNAGPLQQRQNPSPGNTSVAPMTAPRPGM
jgi:hypothetical protein